MTLNQLASLGFDLIAGNIDYKGVHAGKFDKAGMFDLNETGQEILDRLTSPPVPQEPGSTRAPRARRNPAIEE